MSTHAATVPDVLHTLDVLRKELKDGGFEHSALAVSRASHLIVNLVDRATELEAERGEWQARCRAASERWKAAEARATELERERDLRMQGQFKMQDERDVWRERAERAETALRQIVALADNPSRHYDDLGMSDIARAALGEIAK